MKGIDNRTVEGKLQEALYTNGLFENEAGEVIERLKGNPAMEPMKNRWRDSAEGYPAELFNALWLQTSNEAVKWIDEKAPLHWARAMFIDEPPPLKKEAGSNNNTLDGPKV